MSLLRRAALIAFVVSTASTAQARPIVNFNSSSSVSVSGFGTSVSAPTRAAITPVNTGRRESVRPSAATAFEAGPAVRRAPGQSEGSAQFVTFILAMNDNASPSLGFTKARRNPQHEGGGAGSTGGAGSAYRGAGAPGAPGGPAAELSSMDIEGESTPSDSASLRTSNVNSTANLSSGGGGGRSADFATGESAANAATSLGGTNRSGAGSQSTPQLSREQSNKDSTVGLSSDGGGRNAASSEADLLSELVTGDPFLGDASPLPSTPSMFVSIPASSNVPLDLAEESLVLPAVWTPPIGTPAGIAGSPALVLPASELMELGPNSPAALVALANAVPNPEPATLFLFGCGAITIAARRLRGARSPKR